MRKIFGPKLPGYLLLFVGLTGIMLGAAPAALVVPPTDVVVADRAGVLDSNTLLPALRKIDFYQPTKVAVYTYNGSAADNLNEEVLRFARIEHPDWISPDGQKWADGLFIFALDRWAGTSEPTWARTGRCPSSSAMTSRTPPRTCCAMRSGRKEPLPASGAAQS